jgi:hypothetical protein
VAGEAAASDRDGHSADPGPCQRLAGVLTMTRDMLDSAEGGDWERVAELERRRRDDLSRCFSEPPSPEHGELVAEALAVILHLNEELMTRLRDARESVLQQGVAQVRTRAAIGRYQDVKGAPA